MFINLISFLFKDSLKQLLLNMVCSICFETDHNKRTCPFQLKAPIGVDLSLSPLTPVKDIPTASEARVARVLGDILSPIQCRKCSVCGASGHNKRTCPLTEKSPKYKRSKCTLCGANGHNKRTCPLAEIEKENMEKKNRRKCNVCGASGHNKRTCPMKCVPCSDQTLRSYCFAGMSDTMAVKLTKVMDCSSIYGETEEYPQLIHT